MNLYVYIFLQLNVARKNKETFLALLYITFPHSVKNITRLFQNNVKAVSVEF